MLWLNLLLNLLMGEVMIIKKRKITPEGNDNKSRIFDNFSAEKNLGYQKNL